MTDSTPCLHSGLHLLVLGMLLATSLSAAPVTVVEPSPATFRESLAAREIRRYLYLRTGELPSVSPGMPGAGEAVVLLRAGDAAVRGLLGADSAAQAAGLGPEHYLIRTVDRGPDRLVCIIGGDDTGILFGAYKFCERIGVRFYLHGDVVPDGRLTGGLPEVNASGRPRFELRGLLPFHDFPEGPDWWGRDDHRVNAAQLVKLGMNFLTMHCYPEDEPRPNPEPHAEPLVWIGPPDELAADGTVKASYPAFWAATDRDRYWGYDRMRTGEFSAGASQLFAGESHAHEIFGGGGVPATPAETDAVFNRAGAFFADSFSFARSLGLKTCIGTETPLTIPAEVRRRLMEAGKDPRDPEVVREVYRGMFTRIQRLHPVDYYWLWTPESWTWSGNNQEQYNATVEDIRSALGAIRDLGSPFQLATCGWVLGPVFDRTALDQVLPRDVPMSCISREVGHDLIERGFSGVSGRPKWALPWLENDQNLTSPQLWAGRMLYDAADAHFLGCTGFIGVHWRTKILAPTVTAFARAAWDEPDLPDGWNLRERIDAGGLHAGRVVTSPEPVAGAEGDEAEVCRTLLEDCHDIYLMGVPNGRYRVTLWFNETSAGEAGDRVFDVAVQDRVLVSDLDVFARVGRNRVLRIEHDDFVVGDSPLHIGLRPQRGGTSIAACGFEGVTREGRPFSLRINLGGPSVGGFTVDYTRDKPPAAVRRRGLPVNDLYEDFARVNFGPGVAGAAGELFAGLDGLGLPQSTYWDTGPGAIKPLRTAPGAFDFVRRLEALRSGVSGSGNLARFDYWLDSFRYQESLATAGSTRAELDECMAALRVLGGADRRDLVEAALAVRLRLARDWETMMTLLLSCVDTTGGMGTVANLEQHNRCRLRFLNWHDSELTEALGRSLPPEAEPTARYLGRPRLVVPTVRGEAARDEALRVRIAALDRAGVDEVTLHWRPMAGGSFRSVRIPNVGGSVFEAALPPARGDLEYFITARSSDGAELRWPVTAPEICQTVIVLP